MRFSPLALLILSASFLAPGGAEAQSVAIDLGEGGSITATSIQLIALITLLSLAPGIAIMVTCFPFMVTVFGILRQAVGLQQSPPNMLIVSLALFLTYFVMEPVFTESWETGLQPLLNEEIEIEDAAVQAIAPFRVFMAGRADPDTYRAMADLRPDAANTSLAPEAPLSVLIPTFMLSEVARAFQVGFLIFLPFLIIDLVVAAVLMSMGMMMVPPAIVSLPFKLAFFVIADGWSLLAGSLVRGYF
ncbi:flagellar type III secretion system pore protein FliP [Tropicibacter naphthalenivorans]|uniref:Flagellar biosynthetic protein FliP n=1 Tax=Tropicibacter naphthalenivorans TaxID=441103 RepID=A0A0P1GCM1_9RHOB|nr:flagellar type III secretion system pore protein FliP [Tropicibacter naphthalenivorans]CUH79120.1 Flagellar biosynthetic protein FliP precursor [Tropicibacter naphthalenivorans]SMD03406.1 flagellar biosynthetic protein FliP [Tropicibacter naphthalenivorans]